MFDKILIANRGEIAVRIMHTCRRMGIKTVAVYSQADVNALHVREADEAVFIGPSPSTQSYLNIENILGAVDLSGAQAIHPGYGFLSEKAAFAKACEEHGVKLIGPASRAMHLMGDKIESKRIAREAKVSTIPGGLETVSDEAEAVALAREIGYPVMVKAAAGGGGKGMRIAHDEKELREGMASAASEAKSSFGDARVFVEKYIENPRHIEIQVLADEHGNVVYLGERECSIQRRHQKVIEEAPSSFLDAATRKAMGEQAVALAKAVHYSSAGTVECVVDKDRNFYFLEMNTRLQVEHRVTEMITGIDLVEQMIRVAAGEKLAFKQEDIALNGWSFEARVYAEDPCRGFLPSTGRITRYHEPEPAEGLLIDTAIYEGGEVSMFYDPMVAKVCVHAADREHAIERMKTALANFVIGGIAHNITFLEAVLANDRFARGDIHTGFIAEEFPGGFCGLAPTNETSKVFIGAAVFVYLRDAERAGKISGQLPGRQRALGARWIVSVGEESYPVIARTRVQGYDIEYDDGTVAVRSAWQLGRHVFQGTVNGKPVTVQIQWHEEGYTLTHAGAVARVSVRSPRTAELASHMPPPRDAHKKPQLVAPITGMVIGVRVKPGEVVKVGGDLVVIEAMKMENIIRADHEVTIKSVLVKERESVQADQVLLEFEG